MHWLLSEAGLAIRHIAFLALSLGPTIYLVHRWDVGDRAALHAAFEQRAPTPTLTRADKAKRWIAALSLLAASFVLSSYAFPGPWLDSN